MPIYEYTCEKCHEGFEKLVKSMNGQGKIACPKCGSPNVAMSDSDEATGHEFVAVTSKRRPARDLAGLVGRIAHVLVLEVLDRRYAPLKVPSLAAVGVVVGAVDVVDGRGVV